MKGHPQYTAREILRRRLPILEWLPQYSWSKLLQDCLAGITVGLTVIPQGIAYAIVAGLPAQVHTKLQTFFLHFQFHTPIHANAQCYFFYDKKIP